MYPDIKIILFPISENIPRKIELPVQCSFVYFRGMWRGQWIFRHCFQAMYQAPDQDVSAPVADPGQGTMQRVVLVERTLLYTQVSLSK